MSLIAYWHHRSTYPLLSRNWARAWAKRTATFPSLWKAHRYSEKLRRRGAVVGELSFIAPADISGAFSNLEVGTESFIGRVQIQLHGKVSIGSRVCINDGTRIFSASHDVTDPSWKQVADPVKIADYSWIASGAIILPGVTIGYGAVVGAGAVVSRDVPELSIVVGNPARPLEKKRSSVLSYSPVTFLAGHRAWMD